jgi:hypothetical protein
MSYTESTLHRQHAGRTRHSCETNSLSALLGANSTLCPSMISCSAASIFSSFW